MNIDSSGPITIVTLLYFHALSWYKYLAVYSELKWKFQFPQSVVCSNRNLQFPQKKHSWQQFVIWLYIFDAHKCNIKMYKSVLIDYTYLMHINVT